VGSHAVREDGIEFVGGHGAVGYEAVEQGTVHVCVAFVWRCIAHERRVVSRHEGWVGLCGVMLTRGLRVGADNSKTRQRDST
jgi:hypothetical protein